MGRPGLTAEREGSPDSRRRKMSRSGAGGGSGGGLFATRGIAWVLCNLAFRTDRPTPRALNCKQLLPAFHSKHILLFLFFTSFAGSSIALGALLAGGAISETDSDLGR